MSKILPKSLFEPAMRRWKFSRSSDKYANGAVVTNDSGPIVRNFLLGLRPKSSLNKHRDLFIYLVTSQKGVNRGLRSFAYRFRRNYNYYSAPTISTSPYMGYADMRRWAGYVRHFRADHNILSLHGQITDLVTFVAVWCFLVNWRWWSFVYSMWIT